jgi:hypothetical protein
MCIRSDWIGNTSCISIDARHAFSVSMLRMYVVDMVLTSSSSMMSTLQHLAKFDANVAVDECDLLSFDQICSRVQRHTHTKQSLSHHERSVHTKIFDREHALVYCVRQLEETAAHAGSSANVNQRYPETPKAAPRSSNPSSDRD